MEEKWNVIFWIFPSFGYSPIVVIKNPLGIWSNTKLFLLKNIV